MRVNHLLLETEQILNSTDTKQLSQAATATAKLQDVDKQLRGLKGNGRVERTRKYVQEQIKYIKLASPESLDT